MRVYTHQAQIPSLPQNARRCKQQCCFQCCFCSRLTGVETQWPLHARPPQTHSRSLGRQDPLLCLRRMPALLPPSPRACDSHRAVKAHKKLSQTSRISRTQDPSKITDGHLLLEIHSFQKAQPQKLHHYDALVVAQDCQMTSCVCHHLFKWLRGC